MFIELLIVLFDIAFTAGITYLIPTGNYYHYWAPFLLLIGGYILGLVLMWVLLSIYGKKFKKDKEYTKPNKFANFWLCQAIGYINHHGGAIVKIKQNDKF